MIEKLNDIEELKAKAKQIREIIIKMAPSGCGPHVPSALSAADLVRFICPGYSRSCFQRRNEWMVDHASRVIAVWNGLPSGTKNTIDYARKATGVSVILCD